jgi:hypothetical protein
MTGSRRFRRTVRAKRARPTGMSPAARALRSDVVRRAASRGGTLRCAEAPALPTVMSIILRVSSTNLTWLVAGRLQDSAADVVAISFDRAEKAATAERDVTETCNGRFWR